MSNLLVDSEEGPYLVHLMRDSQGTHDVLEVARGLIQLSSKYDAPALEHKGALMLAAWQLEVLTLLSEGKSAKEIGQELYLSQATVRTILEVSCKPSRSALNSKPWPRLAR